MDPVIEKVRQDHPGLRNAGFGIIPGMVNVGFWSPYEDLCYGNLWFAWPDPLTDANILRRYKRLYERGQKRGVNFITLDLIDDFAAIDCFLFSDIPYATNRFVQKAYATGKPRFLILEECEVVLPRNWYPQNHDRYEKIFTWRDDLIDNKRYFKFNNYSIEGKHICKDLTRKKKLCTAIIRNKASSHPLELFSKRKEAVDWFERNYPDDFDLYGYDWDLPTFFMDKKGLAGLCRGKLRFLGRALGRKHPCWRGPVQEKKSILEQYRFALSYENGRGIPGYISEKIFESFDAGTVPVYWGANNVADHIPSGCFIDRRDFADHASLYTCMKKMTDTEYAGYLDRIEDFLNGPKAAQFSPERFPETVITEVLKTVG